MTITEVLENIKGATTPHSLTVYQWAEVAYSAVAAIEQLQADKTELEKRECMSCGEVHPLHIMCPPVEVRSNGDCWWHKSIKRLQAENENLKEAYGDLKSCIEGTIGGFSVPVDAKAHLQEGITMAEQVLQDRKEAQ